MSIPDKAVKCLNLALNQSATDGEWNAAAIRFCAILRKSGIGIDFLDPPPMPGPAPYRPRRSPTRDKKKPGPITTMPFGKFKGKPFKDLPDWYLNWCIEQDFVENPLRAQIDAEIQRRDSEL